MKKNAVLKRTLLGLGSLLLLLIALLTATFLFWLGPTVKLLAEKIGSKALGAPISVEKLSINPRKGTLLLSGFEIGNHEKFGHTNTVSLAEVRITVDMESVFSDTIVVEEILIESPHFVYEQDSATDNITEYITNIFAFAKIDPNQPKEPKPEPEEEEDLDKEPKRVIVNQLRIADVKMSLANTDDPDLDIRVELEELTLSMSNGVVQLKNLTLSDPGLLTTPNIFVLESAEIRLEPESIYSDQIIIEKVTITKPYAYYEQNSETDTLAEFMRIAESFTAKADKKSAPPAETAEVPETEAHTSSKPPGPTVELRELVIDDIQLHVVNIANPELSIRLRLEQLALSPTSGDVQLNNLTLSNPKRLATPNVFELEAIKIKIDPASLTNSTVVIKDVQVIKPYAFLEQNPKTDTVTEFMRIADRIAEGTSKSSPLVAENSKAPEPKTEAVAENAPPPIELHNLLVDDIQLKFLDTANTNAPDGLQTMASIGSISVKLVEGDLRIEAITIPNPAANFTTTNLFHLTGIGITLDPESIFSDQVVIKEVFVDSPKINLEQTETSGNVAELQHIIKGFIPPAPEASTSEPPAAPKEEQTKEPTPLAEQPIVLETLVVTNFVVHMLTPSETNAPSSGLMGEISLNKLKPKDWFAGSDSNAPITLVAFDRLSVEPLKGLIQIDNLQIGNPQGFAHDNLATIAQFRIDIDPDSIQTDTLLIEDILIDTPRIAYERQIATDNIKALQLSIKAALSKRGDIMDEAGSEATPEHEPAATDEPAAAEQKVIIEHLLVQNGMVSAKLSALPSAPIPLPDIERNDMGKEEGGLGRTDTMANLGTLFYDSIIGAVSSITGFAGDALKGFGSVLTLGGDKPEDVDIQPESPAEEEPQPEKKKRGSKRRRIFPR